MVAKKIPFIKLFPGDWMRDQVSACSLSAQGLWLRMMFLGHDAERYGYLSINGLPMKDEFIAKACGSTLPEYKSLVAELFAAGVPSRTPEGIIFSRRMVRDAQDRKDAQKYGRRGGNPNLMNEDGIRGGLTPPLTHPEHEPDSSSSSNGGMQGGSVAATEIPPTVPAVLAYGLIVKLPAEDCRAFFDHFESNGWRVGGKTQMRNWHSAMNNWKRNAPNFKPANGKPRAIDTNGPGRAFAAERANTERLNEVAAREADARMKGKK